MSDNTYVVRRNGQTYVVTERAVDNQPGTVFFDWRSEEVSVLTYDGGYTSLDTCHVCGALVLNKKRQSHVDWHEGKTP